MRTIIGNRNPARGPIVGVDQTRPGDWFVPWYFQENGGDGSRSVDRVALVICHETVTLNPEHVFPTSYVTDVRNEAAYPGDALRTDIRTNGQLAPCQAAQHHFGDRITTGLIEDSELNGVHVDEGHHRWKAALELNLPFKTDLWRLFVVSSSAPERLLRLYDSHFDDSMWTHAVQGLDRLPWFGAWAVRDGTGPKAREITQCLDLIIDHFGPLAIGLDIGCAEGAYTTLLSRYVKLALGVDHELGRICRAWLAVSAFGLPRLSFECMPWQHAWDDADVVLLLSILHHTSDPLVMLTHFSNAKALVVQVRVRDRYEPINQGTRVGIHSLTDYEKMFAATPFPIRRKVVERNGEAFYVLMK